MMPIIVKVDNDEDVEKYLNNLLLNEAKLVYSMIKIAPEKNSISIGQIRDLRKQLQLEGNASRLVVFLRFEQANNEAQNAILKLLEEESARHRFILFSQFPKRILNTVASRCLFLKKSNGTKADVQEDEAVSSLVQNIVKKNLREVYENSNFSVSSSQEAIHFFTKIITNQRKFIIQGDKNAIRLTKNAFNFLRLLRSYNLNAQLSLDLWLLKSIE